MKNFILALLLAVPALLSAQGTPPTEFTWTKENCLTDFIVVAVAGKQSDLSLKTLNWLLERSDLKIKNSVTGESLLIEGRDDKLYSMTTLGMKNYFPVRYVVQINFKDDKYKFDVVSVDYLVDPKTELWVPIELNNPPQAGYYNKKGEMKNAFKPLFEELPKFFTSLSQNLKSSIVGDQNPKKNDW
jgi:hypothetical protein